MKIARTTALLAAMLIAPGVMAQHAHDDHAGHDHGAPAAQPSAPVKTVINAAPQTAPAPVPPFKSLVERGADGKVVRIDGILDIIALDNNPLIDEATRAKLRPAVREWLAEVEMVAIDNLDFLETFEPLDGTPGLLQTIEINDTQKVHSIAQMMTQLMSAGPMSSTLENRGILTRDQSMVNQHITSDYLQQVMNELMAEAGTPNDMSQPITDTEAKTRQVNLVSRFLYGISCRDTQSSYHRMLEQTAPNIEQAVAGLNLPAETVAKLKAPMAEAKAATTDQAKRTAVRNVMKELDFAQRQNLLRKGRELAPEFDPLQWKPKTAAAAATPAGGTPAKN